MERFKASQSQIPPLTRAERVTLPTKEKLNEPEVDSNSYKNRTLRNKLSKTVSIAVSTEEI